MWVTPLTMDQSDGGRPIPKDARKVTEGQAELQDEFDRRGEDPDGPALHESHENIADET